MEYLKKEFMQEPIKGYLELKKKQISIEGKELEENTNKRYEKLLIMS
jgi:hypothetical protein